MLENYFLRPATVDRVRASWLAPQIERYVEWMHAHGYRDGTVLRQVPVLCQFGDFAAQNGAGDLASTVVHVEAFCLRRVTQFSPTKSPEIQQSRLKFFRGPIQQMLRLALEGHVKKVRRPKPFPFQTEASGFLSYLQEERGLRPRTISLYARHLGWFDKYLKQVGVRSIGEISPALVSSFLVDRAPVLGEETRRDFCAQLRVFLRFCYRERIIHENLSATIEMPQIYRLARLPRSITWDEVRRVLERVDRRTACGRRDYALLLMLVTYGFRAHEIAMLTLDDIDWKRERLYIPERKGGHSAAFPLTGVVAEALIAYLKNGRPNTSDRHLFFRTLAPRVPLTSGAISTGAGVYLERAGIKVHKPGAHTFRYTCVQRLIDAEFPLKTVGDYMGHRSPQTTEMYTKLEIAALREVAMGDGEAL